MNFVKIHQGFRSGNFVELYVSKIQVSTLISTCCWPVLTKSPCPVSTIQEVGRHEQFQSYFRGDGKFRDLGRAVCVAHLVCEVHAYFLKYVWSKKREINIIITVRSHFHSIRELNFTPRTGRECSKIFWAAEIWPINFNSLAVHYLKNAILVLKWKVIVNCYWLSFKNREDQIMHLLVKK